MRLFASFSCCARLRDSSGVRVPAPLSISPALALLTHVPMVPLGIPRSSAAALFPISFASFTASFLYSSLYCFPVSILFTPFLLLLYFGFAGCVKFYYTTSNNTERGAKCSAILYSIISTAQANGLDAEKYLTRLFSKPNGTILLPWKN